MRELEERYSSGVAAATAAHEREHKRLQASVHELQGLLSAREEQLQAERASGMSAAQEHLGAVESLQSRIRLLSDEKFELDNRLFLLQQEQREQVRVLASFLFILIQPRRIEPFAKFNASPCLTSPHLRAPMTRKTAAAARPCCARR